MEKAHTDRIFETELKLLKEKILRMGAMVESAIRKAVSSLVNRDSDKAREVIQFDHAINALEVEIDELCIKLLALRQPAAKDLRFITTAMKIVTDMERIGDLCENIAERAIELNQEPILKPYIDIPRMAEAAEKMLKDSLDAFVSEDTELALDVCKRDEFIDNLNEQIFRELLTYMMQDPHTISRAIRISFVSKYLERIADHATNIAEMVVFMVKGKIIRHTSPSQ